MRKAIAQLALHGAFITSVIILWELARVWAFAQLRRLPLDAEWFQVLIHIGYLVLFLIAWESAKKLVASAAAADWIKRL